jgi:hypothetical protein
MLTITAKHELSKLVTQHYLNVETILINERREISQLEETQQKTLWLKYNIIKSYCDNSLTLLEAFVKELEARGDIAEKESLKLQLKAARQYIKSIGGNPSILTYIKEEDLAKETP